MDTVVQVLGLAIVRVTQVADVGLHLGKLGLKLMDFGVLCQDFALELFDCFLTLP